MDKDEMKTDGISNEDMNIDDMKHGGMNHNVKNHDDKNHDDMNHDETDINVEENEVNHQRRKRVNRMKAAIVAMVVLFLALQIFFCIIYGVEIFRLQNQVDELISEDTQDDLTNSETDESNLAYASEKLQITPPGLPSVTPTDSLQRDTKDSAAAESTTGEQSPTEPVTDNASNAGDTTGDGDGDSVGQEVADADSGENGEATDQTTSGSGETEDTETVIGDLNSAGSADPSAENTTDTEKTPTPEVTYPVGKYSNKQVYLTFDDGPSENTASILDILAEYKVKATFFVIGKTDKASKDLYRRIVDEGHTLGMHSYTHKYDVIYNTVEEFDKDFTKLWNLLYDTTGYKPTIYRFPGGSKNGVSSHGMEDFIRYLNNAGITYYDWNVMNGDASGIKYTDKQLIANVLDGVATKKRAIVLMHDTLSKKQTVKTLPKILEKLISEGAQILPIDQSVTPIQMIQADSVK